MTAAATDPPLPAVGSVAPDFTPPSTSGREVTLSDLEGKNVLLAFFPLRDVGRRYVLIDRGGIVRWTFVEETTGTRRENAELLERIRALG